MVDVIQVFAKRYRESQAGRTGNHVNDFTLDYRELLKAARAESAEDRINAEACIRHAATASQGELSLDTHTRDENLILRVRLSREGGEAWLFQYISEASPTQQRRQLADLFEEYQTRTVTETWQAQWSAWCLHLAEQARLGGSILPFKRDDEHGLTRELLDVLIQTLQWNGDSLIRFVSCVICKDSKRLKMLQPRLEMALSQITQGAVQSLADCGILENPRRVILHGKLRLQFQDGELNLGLLRAPTWISEEDVRTALGLECEFARVLTVENETTFLELAKVNQDTLLIQTSYPNRAVLALLNKLPASLDIYHFGDTDPAGFDILRDLRERSGRDIKPLHMVCRPDESSTPLTREENNLLHRLLDNPNVADCHEALQTMIQSGRRGEFEQESLGLPTSGRWPFYT